MLPTSVLRQAAAAAAATAAATSGRTPMIKFLGKRSIPQSSDHNPKVHPASPHSQLPPDFTNPNFNSSPSFSSYRQQAQQHGPLGRVKLNGDGNIGSMPGSLLGPVGPASGEFFDRSELPSRFRRSVIDPKEIDAIETAGATLVC